MHAFDNIFFTKAVKAHWGQSFYTRNVDKPEHVYGCNKNKWHFKIISPILYHLSLSLSHTLSYNYKLQQFLNYHLFILFQTFNNKVILLDN